VSWNWVDNLLSWWATTSLLFLQFPYFMGLLYWTGVSKKPAPTCLFHITTARSTDIQWYWPSPQHTCSSTSRDPALCTVRCAHSVLQRCAGCAILWARHVKHAAICKYICGPHKGYFNGQNCSFYHLNWINVRRSKINGMLFFIQNFCMHVVCF
jgi:hypothetical protein